MNEQIMQVSQRIKELREMCIRDRDRGYGT